MTASANFANDTETVRNALGLLAWRAEGQDLDDAREAEVAFSRIERDLRELRENLETLLPRFHAQTRVVEAARRLVDQHPDGQCDAGSPERPAACPDITALREAIDATQ